MATMSNGETVTFFKFKESGVVALCKEVTETFASSAPVVRDVDLTTGRLYETTTEYRIEFKRAVI